MTNQEIINSTVEYFKEQLSGEATGHDWFHIQRVWKLSKSIALKEGEMDMFVVEMGALLHDIADHKFHGGDDKIGAIKAREYLEKFEIDSQSIDKIVQIVEEISFKGLKVPTIMSTKEGEVDLMPLAPLVWLELLLMVVPKIDQFTILLLSLFAILHLQLTKLVLLLLSIIFTRNFLALKTD